MKIELVVFDMAGTTVRDEDAVNRCLRAALQTGGVAVSADDVNRVMGMPKPLAIQWLLEEKERRPASSDRVQALHSDFLGRMIFFYRTDADVSPTEGALETFAQLRRAKIKIALDTGFSRDIVDAILARLGWRAGETIDFTVASDEVPRGRPHPDLVQAAMRWAGITSAAQVAKVGDTPSDLQEGTAAGCSLVIGVTNGTHTREQLAAHPHTHLVASLRELPALILKHAAPTRN